MIIFSRREDRQLQEAGRRYYSTAFPNPDRVGCPGNEILASLALRKASRERARQWDPHLSHCSPCFREYIALRDQAGRAVVLRRLALTAAALILVAAVWLAIRTAVTRRTQSRVLTTNNRQSPYQSGLLDLRDRAALRGSGLDTNHTPSVLPRAALNLSIYLPTGSEPGEYEVQVTRGPGSTLLRAQGRATLQNHIAVLAVSLDLESLTPGSYFFWIRQAGTSWSYYPVVVKAGS